MMTMKRDVLLALASVMAWLLASGCISHSVQSAPIEIKPIHITMDINLRVQKELDEFFDFEESAAPASGSPDARTDKEAR